MTSNSMRSTITLLHVWLTRFQNEIEFEFETCWLFWERGKWITERKTSGTEKKTNNKFNPHMMLGWGMNHISGSLVLSPLSASSQKEVCHNPRLAKRKTRLAYLCLIYNSILVNNKLYTFCKERSIISLKQRCVLGLK